MKKSLHYIIRSIPHFHNQGAHFISWASWTGWFEVQFINLKNWLISFKAHKALLWLNRAWSLANQICRTKMWGRSSIGKWGEMVQFSDLGTVAWAWGRVPLVRRTLSSACGTAWGTWRGRRRTPRPPRGAPWHRCWWILNSWRHSGKWRRHRPLWTMTAPGRWRRRGTSGWSSPPPAEERTAGRQRRPRGSWLRTDSGGDDLGWSRQERRWWSWEKGALEIGHGTRKLCFCF